MYTLGVLTRERFTLDIFCGQLQKIFDSRIQLEGRYLNSPQMENTPFSANVVLVSGRAQLDEGYATGMISKDNRVIVAKRTLNIENINALKEFCELPTGSQLLIADNTRVESLELLHDVEQLLHRIGIRHIELVPYLPGGTRASYPSTAVTFGMPYLVPEHVDKVIDLGHLQVDISAVIELIQALDYNDEVNYEWLQYVPPIVSLTQQVVDSAREIAHVNNKLKGVIEFSSEGILVLDNHLKIVLCNSKFSEFLQRPLEHIEQKSLHDVLPSAAELQVGDSELIQLRNNSFLASMRRLNPNEEVGLVLALSPANSIREMEIQVRRHLYTKEHTARYQFHHIISKSTRMSEIKMMAQGIAKTDFDVLICGESGTGKELFAQSIHNASQRASGPFVAANVAAFPDTLLESELFGYEDGAFTGARKGGKPGLFELAHQGTLFLDEIGELSQAVQSKLLRVIQEREIRRVGSVKVVPIDVRIIAATNRNLFDMVQNGSFRADLFYRLYVLPLTIPALRDRCEDILPILNHFLRRFNMTTDQLSDSIRLFIEAYEWPGNLRQLENFSYYLGCLSSIHGTQSIHQNFIDDYFRLTNDGVAEHRFNPVQMYARLQQQEDVYVLYDLLKAIQREVDEGNHVSLLRLHERCGKATVSRDMLRRRIDFLSQHQLVKVGRTRQGTTLTELGRQFLHYMEQL